MSPSEAAAYGDLLQVATPLPENEPVTNYWYHNVDRGGNRIAGRVAMTPSQYADYCRKAAELRQQHLELPVAEERLVVMLSDLPGKWLDCDPNVRCGNMLVSVGAPCSSPPPNDPIIIEPNPTLRGTVSCRSPW